MGIPALLNVRPLGACSDPGRWGENTCCNDSRWGFPFPRYRSDRTVLCRGGEVRNFTVKDSFVCGADEEHRFTTALVDLNSEASSKLAVAQDDFNSKSTPESPSAHYLVWWHLCIFFAVGLL